MFNKEIIFQYYNNNFILIIKERNLEMEKIKTLFKKDNYDKEKRTTFWVTIVTSMIVHFQLYALMITGPDTLINSMCHQADIWEAMLLRFGLDIIQRLKGNIVSPVLATLISSVLLGITVILVIDILEIKNKYFKYITAILFAVAPNFSATLTFFYCSDAYILGMLLATLAVYLMRKQEKHHYLSLPNTATNKTSECSATSTSRKK